MRRHWRLIGMALRAAVWRVTVEPPAMGLAGVAGWTVVAAIPTVAMQYLAGGRFSEYGLGLTVCWLVLSVGLNALLLRAEHRAPASAAMLIVSTIVLSVADALLNAVSLPESPHCCSPVSPQSSHCTPSG